MIKTFTPNDIIRYLYRETSEQESASIESALLCDKNLLKVYQELSFVKRQLERAISDPDEKIISSVMAYSKSLDLHA
jgi:hypothetical protein